MEQQQPQLQGKIEGNEFVLRLPLLAQPRRAESGRTFHIVEPLNFETVGVYVDGRFIKVKLVAIVK